MRAGKIVAISAGADVEIIEYNTQDVGTDTSGYTISAAVSGTTGVKLQGTAPASDWTIKGYVKTLA